jgi:hypothetical protein
MFDVKLSAGAFICMFEVLDGLEQERHPTHYEGRSQNMPEARDWNWQTISK